MQHHFTRIQDEIIRKEPRHCVVFAAPGSGKTTVMTEHIAYQLFRRTVAPANILALTFTRQAATELKQRLIRHGAVSNQQAQGMKIGTFHGQLFRILLAHDANIPVLLSQSEQQNIMRYVLQRAGLKTDHRSIQSWLNLSGGIKAAWPLVRPEKRIERIILAEYEKLKRRQHRWDFDDILVAFCELLSRPILRAMQEVSAEYILVDEFQDTNDIQWIILQILSEKLQAPVFVVGDDDQAIYGFRNASPKWLLEFASEFKGAEQQTLAVNFRSDRSILRHSSLLIEHNRRRVPKLFQAHSQDEGTCEMKCWTNQKARDAWIHERLNQVRVQESNDSSGRSDEHQGSSWTCTWTRAILARTRYELYDCYIALGKSSEGTVHFVTFHEAKGKEWDEVHIISATEENPYLPVDDRRDPEEERRLFYVAMTRARHDLFIHVLGTMREQKVRPSHFLYEAGFV